MTGFGEARLQRPRWTIVVEVRTVNNRHFKLSAKISESYAMIEPALEQLVREKVRRGTVQVNLRVERPRRPEDYRLEPGGAGQLSRPAQGPARFRRAAGRLSGAACACRASSRTSAPTRAVPDEDWPEIAAVVGQALAKLEASRAPGRRGDGRRAAARWAAAIGDHLSAIAERGPAGRRRTCKRGSASGSRRSCRSSGVTVEPKDLIREVAILADRCDISEEIVRLRAHLAQFRRDHRRARERGPEARVRRAGDGPRDQHDRLEGQRRRDQPRGRRGQGSAGKDSRAGPKCRMTGTIGQNLPGRLIVVSGPSGSGKSTLVRRLLARPDLRLQGLGLGDDPPAAAGRASADRDYVFLDHRAIRADARRACSNRPRSMATTTARRPSRCAQAMAEGICVLLVIDVQGGFQVRQKVPDALLVFVQPPSLEVLETRLRARGTDDEADDRAPAGRRAPRARAGGGL